VDIFERSTTKSSKSSKRHQIGRATYKAGGLPIIGKLLGHTQAQTTARYAHLDNDPLKRASERIAGTIAAALGE